MDSRMLEKQDNGTARFVELRGADILRRNIIQTRFFDASKFKRVLGPEFSVMIHDPYTVSGTAWSSRMTIKDLRGNRIEVHTPHGCERHRPSDIVGVYLIGNADARSAEALIDRMNYIVMGSNNLGRLVRS